ncbi:acetyltransferase [Aureimonas sp. Leaf454]|uniref:GNAT family N-acetyltransferase n=1 Tax=Aureimonas sp. Leaf454 TaxID=1736381 RepID=UPI0006F583A4|nr:N-acetyltransferase [Aureimonas sp. Leaf454]KQT45298.1 acetyltransferase [Aureimonas sp. Leaf454]
MSALAISAPLAFPPLVRALAPLVTLGAEASHEASAREALLDRAMGPGRRRKASEALRRGRLPAEGLSLAARDEADTLVGTVRLWNVAAGDDGAPALLLGPLAVDPAVPRAGIGSALMRRAIAEAQFRGHRAIVLVGDPGFYERFGFSAERAAALVMPGPFERHRLLGLELDPGALSGAAGLIRPTGRRASATGGRRPRAPGHAASVASF